MKRCFPLLILVLVISCQKETGTGNTNPATVTQQTLLNVSYGADAKQNMDVYLPAGRSTANTKVMILIHGGAWATGDKADFTAYVDTLKKKVA